jgi:hypothetical protein
MLVLGFAGMAKADTVELPLNCAGTYDVNTPPWTTDFDLGVTFSEISHVYIDWSGEINASLLQDIGEPSPTPRNGSLIAYIGAYPPLQLAGVWRGAATYPAPEPFDVRSEFWLSEPATWNNLLDGQETITIFYPVFVSTAHIIDYGSAVLNDATLVVEGTIVPEPASLLLFGTGLLTLLARNKTKNKH